MTEKPSIHTNFNLSDQSPPPREPKFMACRRLEADGRIVEFRRRQAFYKSKAGGGLGRDDSFYRALEEFPP